MDRALVERAMHGDRDAFEGVARAALPRLWSVARRIVRDADTAEDAVQECLVRAWRDLRGLRDPDRFEAWVYRLLVHACRDAERRRRASTATLIDVAAEVRDVTDPISTIELRDELQRGFARLSADHRIALVLRYYVGMSGREVAAALGVPEGTVVSRLHYATRAMRSELEAGARLEAVAVGGSE